jgi:hypothetical protein
MSRCTVDTEHPNGNNEFISSLNELASASSIDILLGKICELIPSMIGGKDCSVFLTPDLVKQYTGKLVKGNSRLVSRSDLKGKPFIVLAASTRPDLEKLLGQAFYPSGYGLTGWIFETAKPLQIRDLRDGEELAKIDQSLEWTDEYHGGEARYAEGTGKVPFLGAPLVTHGTVSGVIRISEPYDADMFPPHSSTILASIARILANLIEKSFIIKRQKKFIKDLIEIGSKRKRQDVFDQIVNEAADLIGCENCELYTLDDYGEKITLRAAKGRYMAERKMAESCQRYSRGQGLTGWVFKTGKPLYIRNLEEFKKKRSLTDEDLDTISDGKRINKIDRTIQWLDCDRQYKTQQQRGDPWFIVVPIKSEIGAVLGVLRLSPPTLKNEIHDEDVQLVECFAGSISLVLHNERQMRLTEILIEIGNIPEKDRLFSYVVEEIPKLVLGRGCSVFLRKPGENSLFLAYTSSKTLKDIPAKSDKVIDLTYRFNEGKTGFVAEIKEPLVINYYGDGELQREKLIEDFERYDKSPNMLRSYLRDGRSRRVGIIRVFRRINEPNSTENGKCFSQEEINSFKDFCKTVVVDREKGLPCFAKPCETYESGDFKHALSFLAVPIISKIYGLLGVLRIPRTSEGNRFSFGDLLLVESVVSRLTSVLENETSTKVFRDINARMNPLLGKNELLDKIVEIIANSIGFEYAAIQLVNNKEDTIETVAASKNRLIKDALDPVQWKWLSHPLNPPEGKTRDIHAHVLMDAKKTLVLGSESPFYDMEIHQKYKHENLIRAFVPIIGQDYSVSPVNIGTIEAAHNIQRRRGISEEEVVMLEGIASQVALILMQRERILNEFLTMPTYHQLHNAEGNLIQEIKKMIGGPFFDRMTRLYISCENGAKTRFRRLENSAHTLSDETGSPLKIDFDYLVKEASRLFAEPQSWREGAKKMGRDLYDRIFLAHHEVLGSFKQVSGMQHELKLCFESSVDFLRVPLEFLHEMDESGDYLILTHPISRHIKGISPGRSSLNPSFLNSIWEKKEILKILLIASNTDSALRHVDEEVSILHEVISNLLVERGIRYKIEHIPSKNASYENVRHHLKDCPFNLLHFAGHGQHIGTRPEKSFLQLTGKENELRDSSRLSADALKVLLKKSTLSFAYLSCCHGADTSEACKLVDNDSLGLAHSVVSAQVPTALGFRWAVNDESAMKFARIFYESLFTNGSVDQAVLEARKGMAIENKNDPVWISPVLISQE